MARRRARTGIMRIVVPLLVVFILIEVVYSLHAQIPSTLTVANLAQAAASRATCTGGEVFVFSKDFANANASDLKRGAQFYVFTCTGTGSNSSMYFLRGQSLSRSDACANLRSPNMCTEVYYGVVADGSSAPTVPLTEDTINTAHLKLVSAKCKDLAIHAAVQQSDCAQTESAIKARYTSAAKSGSIKSQVIPTPYGSANVSMWQNIQNGIINGSLKITPDVGIGDIMAQNPTDATYGDSGLLPPAPPKGWGIKITIPIGVK